MQISRWSFVSWTLALATGVASGRVPENHRFDPTHREALKMFVPRSKRAFSRDNICLD